MSNVGDAGDAGDVGDVGDVGDMCEVCEMCEILDMLGDVRGAGGSRTPWEMCLRLFQASPSPFSSQPSTSY